MSQAPGFERQTRLVPLEGTNGVTIDAQATGDPDRSWIVIDHPFRSFGCISLSLRSDVKQLLDLLDSDSIDLLNNKIIFRLDNNPNCIPNNIQNKTNYR